MIKMCLEKNVFLDVSTIIKCYKMQSFVINVVKIKKEHPYFFYKGCCLLHTFGCLYLFAVIADINLGAF
jgi:hypothetical protein